MVRLRTLGVLDLVSPGGTTLHSVLAQPKRLGLLVYLCVEGAHEYHSREALLPLFWPESDEATARHSLSQVVYKLRQSLGREVIETRGKEELRVAPFAVECDVVRFREHVASGEAAAALELYRGDFLPSLSIPDAAGFERWQARERAQLRRLASEASWSLAHDQLGRSAVQEAEATAARAIRLDPVSESTARVFIRNLAAAGYSAGAIRVYTALETAMAEDLDVSPDSETRALIEHVRAPPPGSVGGVAPAAGEEEDRPRGKTQGREVPPPDSNPQVPVLTSFQPPPPVRRWKNLLTTFGAAVILAGGAFLARLDPGLQQGAPGADAVVDADATVWRLDLVLPDSAPLAFVGAAPLGVGQTALAISPAGDHVAYVGREGASTRLYVRPVDQSGALPLPGTEAAYRPFFSPDGEWIAFFAGRYLKKVAVAGGRPITLGTVAEPFGASWGRDGRILVADRQGSRLMWFPTDGGAPEPQEPPLGWVIDPHLMPDGKWVLHGAEDGALHISSLETGQRNTLTARGLVPRPLARPADLFYGTHPHLLDSGHLVYVSGDGVLQVVPTRSDGSPSSAPVSVLEGIRVEGVFGGAQFAVSRDGNLVYARGENMRTSRFVRVWHEGGARDTLPFPADKYSAFDLSPDGERIVVVIHGDAGPAELWVLDRRSGTRSRIQAHGIVVADPRWDSNGEAVLYSEYGPSGTLRDGITIRQTVTGPTRRDTLAIGTCCLEASPDGRLVAESRDDKIVLYDAEQSRSLALNERRIVATGQPVRHRVVFLAFSPDSDCLAYTVQFSGDRSEVYLSRVGALDVRHQVTRGGGEEAFWTPDGRALVYRNGDRWERVEVSAESEVRIGRPTVVLDGPYLNVPGWSSGLFPDGRSQLLLVNSSERVVQNLVVVLNWAKELESIGRDDRR